mmetsp:Transcript_7399/g.16137  ORF Transcript_7399/g.16137 Transcript_7399/m.16137 type:complete len:612 (+) Transcript_7399:171-2006(+)
MANSTYSNGGTSSCHISTALKCSLSRRQASLTEVETAFLHALLIDDEPSSSMSSLVKDEEEFQKNRIESATKVLNDDILFSIPFDESSNHSECRHKPPRPIRSNRVQLDLWETHEDGVMPKMLSSKCRIRGIGGHSGSIRDSANHTAPSSDSQINYNVAQKQSMWEKGGDSPSKRRASDQCVHDVCEHDNNQKPTKSQHDGEEDDDVGFKFLDVLSDRKVGNINGESEASSWNSSQGGFDHYDTWEVLRDEYSVDFGFQVAVDDEDKPLPRDVDDNEAGGNDGGGGGAQQQQGMFKILGTSADDSTSTPHVLSPPLMDALLNFVPEHLAYDNYWLKYSLIRDGASLDILKRYCRAATHTILAVETTNGEVFGAFASSPWRWKKCYFGTGEAFLWRMRHSRNTPVHCLFEQAQLESEIDVFPYNGSNDYIQLCTSDKIALGGGTVLKKEGHIKEGEDTLLDLDAPTVFLEDEIYGFGLALDENLLHGTTSPCATFGNGNLINSSSESGETFDVMNLEVWGFTSAQTERMAQKSELSMFFARESTISSNLSSSTSISSTSSLFSSNDLSRDRFYRRVGQSDENASDRDAWQYANMMNPVFGSPYGKMNSPYGR